MRKILAFLLLTLYTVGEDRSGTQQAEEPVCYYYIVEMAHNSFRESRHDSKYQKKVIVSNVIPTKCSPYEREVELINDYHEALIDSYPRDYIYTGVPDVSDTFHNRAEANEERKETIGRYRYLNFRVFRFQFTYDSD